MDVVRQKLTMDRFENYVLVSYSGIRVGVIRSGLTVVSTGRAIQQYSSQGKFITARMS